MHQIAEDCDKGLSSSSASQKNKTSSVVKVSGLTRLLWGYCSLQILYTKWGLKLFVCLNKLVNLIELKVLNVGIHLIDSEGGPWCIYGRGLTVKKEVFLWLGPVVLLLRNGRGVTEGIPEHATKGRHFDLNSSFSQQHTQTHTHTNRCSWSTAVLPSGLSRLKDGGKLQMLHSSCGLLLGRRREPLKTGRRRTLMEG